MVKVLEIDWGNKNAFWEKSEEERFEYFYNAVMQYLNIISYIEKTNPDIDMDKFTEDTISFSNVIFFLVHLTTTDEEQKASIEKKWIDRLRAKNTEDQSFGLFSEQGVS